MTGRQKKFYQLVVPWLALSAILAFIGVLSSEGMFSRWPILAVTAAAVGGCSLWMWHKLDWGLLGAIEDLRKQKEELEGELGARKAAQDRAEDQLRTELAERDGTRVAFVRSQEQLEGRVAVRTAELSLANASLKQEIAERRRAEEELQKAHDELESRVAERTLELSQSNELLLAEINERSQSEGERQKLVSLVENSSDLIAMATLEGEIIFLNEAGRRLVGLSGQKQIRSHRLGEFLAPESVAGFEKEILPAITGGKPWEGESMLRHFSSGRLITVNLSLFQVRHPETVEPLCLAVVARDISERKRAENALRQSEERFSKAFQATPVAVGISTLAEGRMVDVNDSFLKLLGFAREEVIGRTVAELGIWANTIAAEQMLETLNRDRSVRDVECLLNTRNGEVRRARAAAELVELDSHPCSLIMLDDITDRLNLESQLRHAQKMEAVGQLAAGVAHDFNNILTIIQGHTSLLLSEDSVSQSMKESLKQVSVAAERAANLTRQLLTFSRRQYLQMQDVDLNVVVQNLSKMLQRLLGETMSLEFQFSPELPAVHADTGMIEQILMNLAVNARDAMPKGGSLTLATSAVDLDANSIRTKPEARAGHFACLTVSDTGCGIDTAHLQRIFEPFFTTKEVGKGTGLGLATVYGIVQQHNGWIEVESVVGKGTVFRIYFPGMGRVRAPERPEVDEPVVKVTRGGRERILVVEDEPGLRMLVECILQRYGYEVVGAPNGVDALEVWKRDKGNFDLLLTDMVMPEGITGRELAQKLRAEDPGLRVIYTSGYSAEVIKEEIRGLREGVNFLKKPYLPTDLADTVRNNLEGSDTAFLRSGRAA